jgi:hypothetical protein
MDHPIPERGGADPPGLALEDRECAVGTGAVGPDDKLLVQPQQFGFEAEVEAGDAGLEAFGTGGGVGGSQQVLAQGAGGRPCTSTGAS